jgi:transposase
VCARDGIDLRFTHLDTTSFARSGEYIPESDEQAMTITHGSSREHRPDLTQAVLERMVSHDGGIPCVSQRGDGHTADLAVFQARTQVWLAALTHAPRPRSWIADSKLYHEDHAIHLRHLGVITRMPNPIGAVSEALTQALALDRWPRLDDHPRYQRLARGHDGMAQRWLVVSSQAALERAEAARNNARHREDEAIQRPRFHLQATRFAMPEAAHEALTAVAQGWTYHPGDAYHRSAHKRYARQGRPTPRLPVKAPAWQIQAHVRPDAAVIGHHKQRHACFVIGTTICASELRDPAVLAAYKRPSRGEGGCRFLNDPLFFVSSLLVKKPCRSQGLLRVMTLALLVSSVAQRRWRQHLAHHHATVPHHMNPPTTSPTLRWGFQLLAGIHRVRVTVQGQVHALIAGLHDVPINVLRPFGEEGCRLYQIAPG